MGFIIALFVAGLIIGIIGERAPRLKKFCVAFSGSLALGFFLLQLDHLAGDAMDRNRPSLIYLALAIVFLFIFIGKLVDGKSISSNYIFYLNPGPSAVVVIAALFITSSLYEKSNPHNPEYPISWIATFIAIQIPLILIYKFLIKTRIAKRN